MTAIKIIFAAFVVILGVTAVVIIRTLALHSGEDEVEKCQPFDSDFIVADPGLVDRFRKAITFKTISYSLQNITVTETLKLLDYIVKTYPTIHSSPLVKREVVADYSVLYTIRGSDSRLKPFMLTAHTDVVPIDEERWKVPPFEGRIDDGYIYGRGTLDDKGNVFGILEALEFLLKRKHQPKRTVYIGFGHDEEVSGFNGAYNIGQLLKSRGVKLEFLMDEGPMVLDGLVPGIASPVAMIGVSEKGYLTVKLSVNTTAGHSSLPPPESSIGILAKAVTRLESNPQLNMFGYGPEKHLLESIAPKMSFLLRAVMSNLWLFSPAVSMYMSTSPMMSALIRTTTSVTMFNAGVKENVIAFSATAIVNHRIHPAQTVQQVFEYDKRTINDERVHIEISNSHEPLLMSSYDSGNFGYNTIKKSIRQIWDDKKVVVAPGVMLAATDTLHYTCITSNIYRFQPYLLKPEELRMIHGDNERLAVDAYQQVVNFYYHLLKNADQAALDPPHKHGEL